MKNKRMLNIIALTLLLSLVLCVGCMRPPQQTVLTQDSQGNTVLAMDLNSDGVADVDASGQVLVIDTGDTYKHADTADKLVPFVLETLGSFGVPGAGILIGVAGAWRAHKFGRIFGNTVVSIQRARDKMAKSPQLSTALDLMDDTLKDNQTLETTSMVRDVKKKLNL